MDPINIHLVNKANAEIKLYGYIGEWQSVNWKQFQKDFEDLAANNDEITLRFNSNGGQTFDGLAIYDLIRNSECKTIGIVEGVAASMAGVLFLACDKRIMAKNARIMTHCAKGGYWGEVAGMRNMVELMEQEESKLKEIFIERTGQKAQTVSTWMTPGADKWFDAKSAINNGFASETCEPTKDVKVPKNISNQIERVINAFEEDTTIDKKTILDMKKSIQVLNAYKVQNTLTDDSTDAQVAEVIENALKAKDAKIQELEAKLKTQNDATINNAIEAAVKDGRITADQKADWKSMLENNLENGLKLIGNLQPRVDVNKALNNNSNLGNPSAISNDRKDWDIRKWETEDPSGLENMYKNNKEEYDRLSKAYYGE